MNPYIIKGGYFIDERGQIKFNNDFNAEKVKRIYLIENKTVEFCRGWQGHKIEKRWFSAIIGSFSFSLIKIDDWENPSKDLTTENFILKSESLDFLYVPNGYVSMIQSRDENSLLLAMSDYMLDEVNDEFRFDKNYFK